DLGIERFTLPLIFIVVGVFVLTRNKTAYKMPPANFDDHNTTSENLGQQAYSAEGLYMGDEYVKIDSIFSGNERSGLSANFRGGKIGTIFGSIKLDCKAAQIQQDVVVDIYCVFGGVELIFPANWIVINEMTS